MQIGRLFAFTAACSMAASPCLAADLHQFNEVGARRSGAGVGAYFQVPIGGARSGQPQAGMRLTTIHDYRDARAQNAPVVQGETFNLRLVGDRQPTLYVAGRPVTGAQTRRANLTGATTIITLAIVGAAIVGGYFLYQAIDDSGGE